MINRLMKRTYERLTGRPWTTTVSATEQFGPPPGAVYREQLSGYSDIQLLTRGPEILAQLRADGARQSRATVRVGRWSEINKESTR